MTSLRARLLLGLVVLAAIGLAIAGTVTYSSLRSFLYDRVDQQLLAARNPVLESMRFSAQPGFRNGGRPDPDLPAGTHAILRDSSGLTAGSLGEGGPNVALDARVGKPFTQGAWRVRVDNAVDALGQTYTLAVAIPLDDARETLGKLLRVELIVAVGVLGGLAALAWWVVQVGLRPLEVMGETAGAIAAGDLSRRVEPADGRTEVGRLGESLNAMLHQIEGAFAERTASEERLRRFVADAAHELRTPLTSIRGYAELFRRGASDRPDDLAKSMQRIEAEASRMGVLVDDLLLLARLDQGRPLELAPVDLVAVTREVVEDARVTHPARSISFEVSEGAATAGEVAGGAATAGEAPDGAGTAGEVPDGEVPDGEVPDGEVTAAGDGRVAGDEGRLRQAVQNLVTNAIVHTPPTATVRVSVTRSRRECVVEVADTGPGIPADEVPHLFERFYRIDHSRARSQGGGTGLGLSIVAAVAQAHGGRAEVESTLGAGARFRIRLPVRAPAPSSTGERGSVPAT